MAHEATDAFLADDHVRERHAAGNYWQWFRGKILRPHTIYDVPTGHMAADDAMGIMIAYTNPS